MLPLIIYNQTPYSNIHISMIIPDNLYLWTMIDLVLAISASQLLIHQYICE